MSSKVELDIEKCNGCEECIETCTAKLFEMRNGKSVPLSKKDCVAV